MLTKIRSKIDQKFEQKFVQKFVQKYSISKIQNPIFKFQKNLRFSRIPKDRDKTRVRINSKIRDF